MLSTIPTIAAIMPKRTTTAPPITGVGIVLVNAFSLGIRPIRIVITAAMRITLGSYTLVSATTPVFWEYVVLAGPPMKEVRPLSETGRMLTVVVIVGGIASIAYLGGRTVQVLVHAGIERASSLISVVGTDAENVFTTLTARALNREHFIVTRATNEQSEPKLRAAGADRVIQPYELVAHKLAQLVLRPGIVEYIETVQCSPR